MNVSAPLKMNANADLFPSSGELTSVTSEWIRPVTVSKMVVPLTSSERSIDETTPPVGVPFGLYAKSTPLIRVNVPSELGNTRDVLPAIAGCLKSISTLYQGV